MTRVNLLLLVALLASSVWLVRVSYESRRLFAALDRARTEERTLDNDGERLKAELRAQATPLRVERTARERLAMRSATPAVTQYVTLAALATPAPGRPGRSGDGADAGHETAANTASTAGAAAVAVARRTPASGNAP